MNLLFFDTETTGLPRDYNAPYTDVSNFPRLVQIAWILYRGGQEISSSDMIVKPDGFEIPEGASNIHRITTAIAMEKGMPLKKILNKFYADVLLADTIVAHNISFDNKIYASEMVRADRLKFAENFMDKPMFCTMHATTDYCKIPGSRGDYKWPKLSELYNFLFREELVDAHDALVDIRATSRCFFELEKREVININEPVLVS